MLDKAIIDLSLKKDSMNLEVNNRELLRGYKQLREKLVKGEVDEIRVPQKNGVVLKITVEKQKTPFQEFLEMVRENPPLPIDFERPEEDII